MHSSQYPTQPNLFMPGQDYMINNQMKTSAVKDPIQDAMHPGYMSQLPLNHSMPINQSPIPVDNKMYNYKAMGMPQAQPYSNSIIFISH